MQPEDKQQKLKSKSFAREEFDFQQDIAVILSWKPTIKKESYMLYFKGIMEIVKRGKDVLLNIANQTPKYVYSAISS